MAKKKNNYYVVWQGRCSGIYASWAECEKQVKGVAAKYKGFATRAEAEKALSDGFDMYIAPAGRSTQEKTAKAIQSRANAPTKPIYPSLSVDAACSGNPGVMEFRGVIADTGTEVFHRGPYKGGTNNIGEFLGIVLGLAYLKQNNLPWVLYSDSRTALSWLKKGHANSKLQPNAQNAVLFEMIEKAEQWLANNTYTTHIYKWDTEHWGKIPADFGRK